MLGALAVFGLSLIYKGVTSVIALFALVMGGIYGGVFTAVEGAGVGAFGAMVFALARALAHLEVALRLAGRERAHHLDAVHDPDRRADVRRVRQHHHACPTT